MSEDDKGEEGKYKGHFEEPPQKKGGRRGQNPNSRKGLANLKPWPKGTSGNILGQPKSVVELNKQVRDMMPGVYQRMARIVHDPNSKDRDRIAAATLLDARGCGRPAIGIFHGTGPGQPPGFVEAGTEDGNTLLLRAANANADERILAELNAAQRRIEAKIAQEKQAHEAHLADATVAMAEGRKVDGLTRMLLHAKAASADRAAAPAPTRPTKRIEAKPNVFVADSSGNIAAPAPTVESAPSPAQAEKSAPAASPPEPEKQKAPPFKVEDPSPAPKSNAKPAHPGASIPGFGEFLSAKATSDADAERARKQEAARAAGRPGGQLTPAEAFPADPRPPMEVVNFTRVAGGKGIRRC